MTSFQFISTKILKKPKVVKKLHARSNLKKALDGLKVVCHLNQSKRTPQPKKKIPQNLDETLQEAGEQPSRKDHQQIFKEVSKQERIPF